MAKRIVYHAGDISKSGGIERIVVLKANWLAEHGYEVTMLLAENKSETYYPLSPLINVVCLNVFVGPVWKVKRNFWGAIKSAYWVVKNRIDHKRKVVKYLNQHPCDIFVSLMLRGFIPKLKDGSKKIFEIHFSKQSGTEFGKTNTFLYNVLFNIEQRFQEQTIKRFDKFVVLTERDKKMRGNIRNMVAIPNFISVNAPEILPNYNSKNVIIVGTLGHAKGYEYMLDAWEIVTVKHPDWKLHIYGHSNETDPFYAASAFLARIAQRNLKSQIVYHGEVSNIQEKYLESSFYVMSSRYEGFPLCLGEAMACGLPCISYDCNCGPSEIIRDKEDGLLVSPVGDVEKLADAINYLIENPAEREKMGKKAKQNIQRFRKDNVMQKWVELFG